MMSVNIQKMTSALSELIAQEVEKTLGRLRSKIVEAADIEDDFEIDLSKFAQNTAKKVVSSEAFTEMVGQITSAVKEAEKKDPDAPKGAKNAFIFFCNEKRQEVKEENASLKATEITKKLGEMWKEEEDEEKKRYQKMAEDDKKRYAEEIAEYEPKDEFKNPKSPKKSKKVKSTAPKRALSAYLFFCQATREDIKKKNPSIKSSEILSELGKIWKALSEKKRKPFDKLAEEDKKRYEEEMKEYVPTEEEKDAMEAKKGKKGASKVSKRSPTAYLLFCNEKREEVKNANKDKKTTEITSILGNMWTNLSENKKNPYKEKAAKLKEAFDSEEEKNEQEDEKKVTKNEAEKKVTKKTEKNDDEKKVTKKVEVVEKKLEKNEQEDEKKVTKKVEKNEAEKKVTKKTEKNDDEKKVTKKVEVVEKKLEKKVEKKVTKKVEVVEEEEVEEEEEDDETILEDDDEDDE